jgi:hypothetical protein
MRKAIVLVVLFCSTLAIAEPAAKGCTRAGLQSAVDKYLEAMKQGNPSLLPLAAQAKYVENRKPVPLGQGISKTPLDIDLSRSLLDVDTCQTFTEIIHTNPSHPYVIGTRLKVEDGKISEIEALVTQKGDWLFNAADYLKYSSQEKWNVLPPAARSDRQTLLQAANAYFDVFGDYSALSRIPLGIPCARLEGGMSTNPKGDPKASCNIGFPTDGSIKVVNRRFIVDVDMGTVVGLAEFGAKNGVPDAHTFRLENGKLRYVHTLTVCTIANCGFPALPPQAGNAK